MGILRVAGRRHHVVFLCVNPHSIPCEILSDSTMQANQERERAREMDGGEHCRPESESERTCSSGSSSCHISPPSLVLVAAALDRVHELSAPPFARRCCLQSSNPANQRAREREREHASFSATTRNTKRTSSSAIIEMRESRAARRLSAAASRLLKKRRKRARGGGRLAIALRCFFLRLFLSRSFIRLLLLSLSLLLLSRSFVRCCCPSRCCCCSLVHSLAAAVPLAVALSLALSRLVLLVVVGIVVEEGEFSLV